MVPDPFQRGLRQNKTAQGEPYFLTEYGFFISSQPRFLIGGEWVMSTVIQLIVNGERREFEKNSTVADVLGKMGSPAERVAVELNLQILNKQDYSRTVLNDEDRLEIINFVGGG